MVRTPLWKEPQDLFFTLRFRLDQLEYKEHLDTSSVLLVQRLLSDLIQTTESTQTYKSKYDLAIHEKTLAEEQVLPLKNELCRITAENNQLHRFLDLT
jgi:hypothetical protein